MNGAITKEKMMRYHAVVIIIVASILFSSSLIAQFFVDSPYPSSLLQGDYNISLRIGPEGALLARLSSVPFRGISIGISYGGERILGYEDPLFYPNIGVEVRLLVLEESQLLPLIILGFDSQGYDWNGEDFAVKEKGIYSLFGKEIGMFNTGIGINYNTNVKKTGFFGGAIINLSQTFGFVGDYSFYPGTDERQFLSIGLRTYFEGILFQFVFRDITGRKIGRAIDLGYAGYF